LQFLSPVTTDHHAQVRAAAYAAASWGRARRATWTDPDADPAAAFGVATTIAEPATTAVIADPMPAFVETEEKEPPFVVTLVKDAARSFEPAKVLRLTWRALTALAAIASIVALALIGREYWGVAMKTQTAAKVRAAAALTPPRTPAPAISVSTGQLHVTAAPKEARVIVDGTPRGVTPLLVENLKVGSHSVVLQSADGTVEESVKIAAGDTQELSGAIYPGWLTLYSPFDVVVSERGRALALDERHQVLLAPGPHDLRIENRALGYEETRHVDIRPGESPSLSIVPPKSTMTVTTGAPAQVWIDGTLVGDTPVDVAVELGTHALVVKYASGEQRQQSVTITAKPLTVEM
jgi:hypothetical protein